MTNPPIRIYAFKRNEEFDCSLNIERMEDIFDRAQGNPDHPHRHEYYTVIWVKEGEGNHIVDFHQYKLEANQVYFVSPGQIHQLLASSRPTGWVFTFHPDFLIESDIDPEFMANINLFKQYSDSPPIALKDDQRLNKIMDLFGDCFQDESEFKTEALGAVLQLFLIECIRQSSIDEPEVDTGKSCVLVDFKKAVESNYADKHKVAEYAEMLFITPKHLNEVVKSTIGVTAKEYIIDRILTEGKRLLIHTDLTVKQIAINIGFSEPIHFNSFFKSKTGQTPLQFRSRHQH